MEEYVKQGLKRVEALDFLRRDFPQYPWSVRSLERAPGNYWVTEQCTKRSDKSITCS
jgi:hypothetical protein